jgi:type III pantothenate kinase
MILEIDAGNTRIKWRVLGSVRSGDTPMVLQGGIGASIEELLPVFSSLSVREIVRVRLVSVRGAGATTQLLSVLRQVIGLDAELARATSVQAGVTHSYTDPESFGVDRWLMMLAAWNIAKDACCVVGCGTAITVDVMDGAGMHRGGFIFPGLSLQRTSLLQNTAIPLAPDPVWRPEWSSLALGTSTADAVNNGIFSATVRAVAGIPQVTEAAARAGLFLAGGDAPVLASGLRQLGIAARCEPDLVMDGLHHAIP